MSDLFLLFLKTTLSASAAACAVILLRLLFRRLKAPVRAAYLLWVVVLLRPLTPGWLFWRNAMRPSGKYRTLPSLHLYRGRLYRLVGTALTSPPPSPRSLLPNPPLRHPSSTVRSPCWSFWGVSGRQAF